MDNNFKDIKENHENISRNDFDDYSIDFKDIYFIIFNNIKLFLSIIFSVFFISIIYIYLSIPLYKSQGSILIESGSGGLSLFSDLGIGDNKNAIDNEVQILKSNATIIKALDKLISTNEYSNMHLFGTKEYSLSESNQFLRKLFLLDYFSKNAPINIENEYEKKKLVKLLKEKLEINKINKTDIIQISILTPNPYESALIINTLVNSYQTIDREWNNGEMIHMKIFLESQIAIKEKELKLVEDALSLFQKEEGIYGLDGNAELLLKQLTLIESDYYGNKAKENILKERKKYLYNELSEKEKVLTEKVMNTINEQLFALKNEIAQRESDLISAIALQGEEHQAITSGRKTLNKLKETLKEQTKVLISQGISTGDPIQYRQGLMDTILVVEASQGLLASRSKELNKLVEKYENELSNLPDKALKFARLERERSILSETYSLMMQKREEAKIREASQLGKIRIIDLASSEIIPVKPNKLLILVVSILLSTFLGIIVCFLKEYLDNTIKSLDEIERYDLDILAMIPTITSRSDGENKNLNLNDTQKLERRLITYEDSKSPISEAYRTLRTNLMYRFSESKGQTILVSSPGPGEGKTTTISNLAITFANLGKKTLLIDTDLRKPVMHTVFSKKQSPGLTDYLMGKEDEVEKIINKTDIDNFSLMTSGNIPPFPSELLGSDRMRNLIIELRSDWDVVLFDLPPLMAVTDAYMILKEMDQFLLVLRAGVTQKGALKRSMSYLKVANILETGVVINQIDKSKASKDEHFDYYAEYYGVEEE